MEGDTDAVAEATVGVFKDLDGQRGACDAAGHEVSGGNVRRVTSEGNGNHAENSNSNYGFHL